MGQRAKAGQVAITGATGEVGRRVLELLRGAGVRPRVIVRDRDRFVAQARSRHDGAAAVDVEAGAGTDVELGIDVRQASYDQAEALTDALRGVDTFFMVSAAESGHRAADHRAAVGAAARAGVRHLVYLSFLGAADAAVFTFARDHADTERAILESGMEATFLRDSFYHAMFAQIVGADGMIRGPAGTGRVSGVGHDDVAACVAEVMRDPVRHRGKTYDVTGPEAYTLDGAARVLSSVTGRSIRYHPESPAEAYESRAGYNAEAWEVEGWVSSSTAIAAGELELVSSDVETLTGRAAVGFREYLQTYPGLWRRLTG